MVLARSSPVSGIPVQVLDRHPRPVRRKDGQMHVGRHDTAHRRERRLHVLGCRVVDADRELQRFCLRRFSLVAEVGGDADVVFDLGDGLVAVLLGDELEAVTSE